MALPNEPDALATTTESVRHLFVTAFAFSIPLRSGEGFNQGAFDALCQSLEQCANEWTTSDTIPKVAANLLVDLHTGIEASAYQYQEGEASKIIRAAYRIADLVRECVAVPELHVEHLVPTEGNQSID